MEKHHCRVWGAIGKCGPAITDCKEDERGRYIVDNGEYAQAVNYCPQCGKRAPTPVMGSSPYEEPYGWQHLDE